MNTLNPSRLEPWHWPKESWRGLVSQVRAGGHRKPVHPRWHPPARNPSTRRTGTLAGFRCAQIHQSASTHAPLFHDHGKEMVLHAACLVAAADGDISRREAAFVHDLGAALGMSEAHVRGVFASAFD